MSGIEYGVSAFTKKIKCQNLCLASLTPAGVKREPALVLANTWPESATELESADAFYQRDMEGEVLKACRRETTYAP